MRSPAKPSALKRTTASRNDWRSRPTRRAASARLALHRLRADGWSDAAVAGSVGAGIGEVAALETQERCSRLLAVRLVGLARRLPGTVDDEDLAPVAVAA